jgi:S-adenosylmethionine hydrolase
LTPLPVTFLSDYGAQSDFVGVCHAVMLGIAPDAVVIDLAHDLPASQIRPAALVLRNTLPFLSAGVHLAVVDPGVGTARRPVALRTGDGRFFVGPDNGLLSLAAAEAGGIEQAVDLHESRFRLEPVSATFHGRDIFAPVAAHLALGAPIDEAGELFSPDEVVQLELPVATVSAGKIEACAVYVDRFGNVQLNVTRAQMDEAGLTPGSSVELEVRGTRHRCIYARAFADVPEGGLIAYEDAYRTIALAVNRGDAARLLGLGLDMPVRLLEHPLA